MATDWGSIIGGVIGAGIGSFGGPQTAVMGGTIGAGIGGSITGKKKSKDQPDHLAGIRSQLESLYSEIPSIESEMNKKREEWYGKELSKGNEDIAENIHATRGFGKTTLEDRLQTDLLEQLGRAKSADELAQKQWAFNTRASLLKDKAGMTPGAVAEEPSMFSQLAGPVAELAGQYIAGQGQMDALDRIFNKNKVTGDVEVPESNLPDFESLKGSLYRVPGSTLTTA